MTLAVGSLFAGIGGLDLGFERAGMRSVWQVEIDAFCRKILAVRFPNAERFNDVVQCGRGNLDRVDVICGGSPCQGFSVAGKRGGLDDERSGLFREYARILRELRPRWFVFENVPGLLSQNDGRDFAEVLRVFMVECGYGVSWRVLNSQFFGVAQRRNRLFVVGYLGRPCPPEILFEPTGRSGNPETGEETWESPANAVTSGVGRIGSNGADDGANIVVGALSPGAHPGGFNGQDAYTGRIVASSLKASDGFHWSPRGDGSDNVVAAPLTRGSGVTGNDPGRRREDDINLVAATLPADHRFTTDSCVDNLQPVATLNSGGNNGGFRTEPGEHLVFGWNKSSSQTMQCRNDVIDPLRSSPSSEPAVSYALRSDPGGTGQAHNVSYAVTDNMRNRSQGPGNYVGASADSDRMRDFAGLPVGLDSARYRALGNAVTVTVAEWIGKRIVAYEKEILWNE